MTTTDRWGDCPDCGHDDGYVNIGKGHSFFCREHKTTWFVGSNLFSIVARSDRGRATRKSCLPL